MRRVEGEEGKVVCGEGREVGWRRQYTLHNISAAVQS